MKNRFKCFLLYLCAIQFIACAPSLKSVVNKYNEMPNNKALVLGIDARTDKYLLYSYSSDQVNERSAIDDAMNKCMSIMRSKSYSGECTLYSVNDQIVFRSNYVPIEERESLQKSNHVEMEAKTEQNDSESTDEDDMKDEKRKGFISVAYTLINDAFDLLPIVAASLQEVDGIDEIIDSTMNSTLSSSTNFSLDPNNCGTQLAHIIIQVYGDHPSEDVMLPQSVYYEGYKTPKDISKVIKTALKKIGNNPKGYRDKYNLALNIYVNQLITDYNQSKKRLPKVPKEGVYIRNDDEHLYPYEVIGK